MVNNQNNWYHYCPEKLHRGKDYSRYNHSRQTLKFYHIHSNRWDQKHRKCMKDRNHSKCDHYSFHTCRSGKVSNTINLPHTGKINMCRKFCRMNSSRIIHSTPHNLNHTKHKPPKSYLRSLPNSFHCRLFQKAS